jgi:hypothetical protein
VGVPDNGNAIAAAAAKKASAERDKKRREEMTELKNLLTSQRSTADERMEALEKDRDAMHEVIKTVATNQGKAEARMDMMQDMIMEIMTAMKLNPEKYRQQTADGPAPTPDDGPGISTPAPQDSTAPNTTASGNKRSAVSPSPNGKRTEADPTKQQLQRKRCGLIRTIEQEQALGKNMSQIECLRSELMDVDLLMEHARDEDEPMGGMGDGVSLEETGEFSAEAEGDMRSPQKTSAVASASGQDPTGQDSTASSRGSE